MNEETMEFECTWAGSLAALIVIVSESVKADDRDYARYELAKMARLADAQVKYLKEKKLANEILAKSIKAEETLALLDNLSIMGKG